MKKQNTNKQDMVNHPPHYTLFPMEIKKFNRPSIMQK